MYVEFVKLFIDLFKVIESLYTNNCIIIIIVLGELY